MSKTAIKPIGIALIAAGAGLAFWGQQKSGGLKSQFSNIVSGSPGDNVMMLYIAGAACAAVGIFLFLKK
jgi:hypothetical protein